MKRLALLSREAEISIDGPIRNSLLALRISSTHAITSSRGSF